MNSFTKLRGFSEGVGFTDGFNNLAWNPANVESHTNTAAKCSPFILIT